MTTVAVPSSAPVTVAAPLHTILFATDGSPDAALARRAAHDLTCRAHARLVIVGAWNPWAWPAMVPASGEAIQAAWEGAQQEQTELVENEARLAETVGVEVQDTRVEQGYPADVILANATEARADLIVVGSRGRGPVRRLVLGSISEDVVHRSHVPVLVMRGGNAAWPPQRIVVGDDGASDDSAAGVRFALAIGRVLHAPVEVVQVVPPIDLFTHHLARFSEEAAISFVRAALETRVGALAGDGPRPQTLVRIGEAAEELLGAARGDGPALLVTGTHGRGRLQRLRLGSVSTAVIHAAECPVAVVPLQS